jgi:hypothetical protein
VYRRERYCEEMKIVRFIVSLAGALAGLALAPAPVEAQCRQAIPMSAQSVGLQSGKAV